MSLDNIAVVLVRTSHPGNIGAAARAMANMGLSDLRLIEPTGFPGPEAIARAAGASHVLENAQICRTLDEAIADSGFVVGTTARPRSIAWPSSAPASAMTELLAQSRVGKVSLLFGREASETRNVQSDRVSDFEDQDTRATTLCKPCCVPVLTWDWSGCSGRFV